MKEQGIAVFRLIASGSLAYLWLLPLLPLLGSLGDRPRDERKPGLGHDVHTSLDRVTDLKRKCG